MGNSDYSTCLVLFNFDPTASAVTFPSHLLWAHLLVPLCHTIIPNFPIVNEWERWKWQTSPPPQKQSQQHQDRHPFHEDIKNSSHCFVRYFRNDIDRIYKTVRLFCAPFILFWFHVICQRPTHKLLYFSHMIISPTIINIVALLNPYPKEMAQTMSPMLTEPCFATSNLMSLIDILLSMINSFFRWWSFSFSPLN